MEIEIKPLAQWIFESQWLELLKSELAKRLPDKDVQLVIEDNLTADYAMKIDGSSGRVILWVNIHERAYIETIFKQSYLNAVIEHEINHLNPNVIFQHDTIPAPIQILKKQGIITHNHVTMFLTDIFQNYLKEIYANSEMSAIGLRKYLEFEVYKLKETWSKRHGTYRMMWMLIAAYVEVCYNMIGELIPTELSSIVATLLKHPIDASIYEQIKVTYRAMWNAVKAGQRNVNLLEETYQLNELAQNQRNPFL